MTLISHDIHITTDNTTAGETIVSASGMWSYAGTGSVTIAGLSTYAESDNLFNSAALSNPTAALFTESGFSFSTMSTTGTGKDWNLFANDPVATGISGTYALLDSGSNPGGLIDGPAAAVTLTATSVPEPGATLLGLTGMGILTLMSRRKEQASKAKAS